MKSYKFTKEQAREFLKQEALKEINDSGDFTTYHGNVFCVIAKYGLQYEAKEEGLLTGDEWNDPTCKEELQTKIEQFFNKYIQ